MSIVDGRKRRRQRVAGKPAAVNPPLLIITALPLYTIFFPTHTLSNLLQTQLIRFDAGAITFRGPTVGLTEPIVIIDTRQLFHSGPMPIIGFKCMTSWVSDFNVRWRGQICFLSVCDVEANLTIVQFRTGNLP